MHRLLRVGAALLAVAGVGRARGSGVRMATFLLLFTGLALFVGAVATSDFTWRYRMPLVILAAPAAALAVTALPRRRASGPAKTG